MRTGRRAVGIVVVATVLLAGCGDGGDTEVVTDDGNDNAIRLTATPFAGTPTVSPTPQPTETVQATETPGPGATATPGGGPTGTPGPGATETEAGPTSTPGPGATRTPTPGLTRSPTPAPTATGGAATCGNGVKDAGEQCDTGSVFSTHADCGGDQCACCLCRPDSIHASVPMTKCSTCHPSIGPEITFPPGAAQTFPGLCE
jgi:hypothetical protein